MAAWPLIGWDIFNFSPENAEHNSTKLYRKQCFNILYQVCFSSRSDNKDCRPSFWLAETFWTFPFKQLNGSRQNLTESKISTSSTKFVADRKIKMAALALAIETIEIVSIVYCSNEIKLLKSWALVNGFNHTSGVAVVTPTDRPKSVRNRFVIEVFGGVFCVVKLLFGFFCGCRGFCHRTESDLFLFIFIFYCFSSLQIWSKDFLKIFLNHHFQHYIRHCCISLQRKWDNFYIELTQFLKLTCCQQRTFFLKPLNWICGNLIGSMNSMPIAKFVFFSRSENQDGHPGLWLAKTFSTSLLRPLNGILGRKQ